MIETNFICKVVKELMDNKISINLKQTKDVEGIGGWFDATDKEFVVALNNKMGFETLLHEYTHFLQWKNRKRFFNRMSEGNSIFYDWLSGTFYKKDVVDSALCDVIELEWDCESKVVELVKEYKLPVNLEKYCKTANAYLKNFHFIRDRRTLKREKSIYSKAIINLMDDTIHPLDYYLNKDNISEVEEKEYLKLF